MKLIAEYVWIDGQLPTAKLRSKAKVLEIGKGVDPVHYQLPTWGFDGSSTEQALGNNSDCGLIPVSKVRDPFRDNAIIALCEVTEGDGTTPHTSNTRHILSQAAERYQAAHVWGGIEQEYTLYRKGRPLGWPSEGYPDPQGKYYCGVGYDEVHGRPLVEEHLRTCVSLGLAISGINAEVMPAQWEFQIGPLPPVELADQLWLARWLLYRIGEKYEAYAKLDPKPEKGDWNGAGAHTNFSTKAMRKDGGMKHIEEACERLEPLHTEHIQVYGANNHERLLGTHETCSIDEFRYGIGDRGASIRIPRQVAEDGMGYLEDRRPAANKDPYKSLTALLESVCGDGFDPAPYGWVGDWRSM